MSAIAFLDQMLAIALPTLGRILAWGAISGIVSMALYARISPQEKLHALKAGHKGVRSALLRYDGEWAGMKALIRQDLTMSLKQVWLVLIPFLVSVSPVVTLLFYLPSLYQEGNYVDFGPEWMRGFECWYLLSLLIVSLFIKVRYKIA